MGIIDLINEGNYVSYRKIVYEDTNGISEMMDYIRIND